MLLYLRESIHLAWAIKFYLSDRSVHRSTCTYLQPLRVKIVDLVNVQQSMKIKLSRLIKTDENKTEQ